MPQLIGDRKLNVWLPPLAIVKLVMRAEVGDQGFPAPKNKDAVRIVTAPFADGLRNDVFDRPFP